MKKNKTESERSSTVTRNTLFDYCCQLDPEVLHEVVRIARGAAYLIRPSNVAANTRRLLDAAKSEYANTIIAYSYKTNYNKTLVEASRSQGAYSEVVSIDELDYAKSLNVPDCEIIFNGPGKTTEILRSVAERELILVADSIGELFRINQLKDEGCVIDATIGIRVTPELSFQSGISRFGIDLESEENRSVIKGLVSDHKLEIKGIHLHYTGNRSADSYVERLEFLVRTWNKLEIGPPGFVDCGGGFASAIPREIRNQLPYHVDELETYGSTLGKMMKRLFPDETVQFIFEPGTGILSDAGVFVTPVLDVKRVKKQSIAVVDGTCFCVNPLRSSIIPAVARVPSAVLRKVPSVPPPVAVYGNSCLEIDLHIRNFELELKIGDLLVFGQKGAYTSCMATPFIQGIPAVVTIDTDNSVRLVRERTNSNLLNELN